MAAAAVVLTAFMATARAQPEMTVMTGAGGVFRAGAFVPVLVILNNDNIDRNGRLEAALPSAGRYIYAATRELPLPENARKAAFLYLPSGQFTGGGFRDELRVRYVEGGKVTAEVFDRLTPRESTDPIVCGTPRLPLGAPALLDEADPEFLPVFMPVESLARHHAGLEMFDVIIMAPAPARPLETETASALRDWVLRGGTLVVAANRLSDAFLSGGLADMMPFIPEATAVRQVDALGEAVPIAAGRIKAGEVLLGAGDAPLVIRRGFGLGSITCFAIDPDADALNAWTGSEDLWRDLLGAVYIGRSEDGMAGMLPPQEATLEEAVQGPVNMGLRLGLVLLLTLVYALAVGPADFLLIRKLKRPALTWATFPLMVAGFTALAYAGARVWMGGTITAENARRTLVAQDAGYAVVSDISSIFVPAAGRYRVEHENELILRPFGQDWTERRPFVLDVEEKRVEQELPIWKRWQYRSSVTAPAEEAPLGIQARFRQPEGGREVADDDEYRSVVLSVTNHTGAAYRLTRVLYRDRLFRLRGVVGPGETREWALGDARRTEWKREPGQMRGWGRPSISEAHVLGGLWGDLLPIAASAREFDLRDALRRGAVIAQLRSASPTVDCPLVVNGKPRPEVGTHYVQLVAYPEENL
jgi:hypothetical protein